MLMDTNAYSELARGNAHVRLLVEHAAEIILPTVVLGELHAGFALGSQTREHNRGLAEFLKLPGVRIFPVDHPVAERYGDLIAILRKNGTPVPTNDIWIAATALESASRVLTFDSHYDLIPGIMRVLT